MIIVEKINSNILGSYFCFCGVRNESNKILENEIINLPKIKNSEKEVSSTNYSQESGCYYRDLSIFSDGNIERLAKNLVSVGRGGVRKSKPVYNVKVADSGGIYVFDDVSGKTTRLNIVAHGGFSKKTGEPAFIVNSDKLTAEQFHAHLGRHVDFSKYYKIRLVVCHSGEGVKPLGQQIANLTGSEVKAFKGSVATNMGTDNVTTIVSSLRGIDPNLALREAEKLTEAILSKAQTFYMIKDPSAAQAAQNIVYDPVKFTPEPREGNSSPWTFGKLFGAIGCRLKFFDMKVAKVEDI